jgi:hypothetical protein
MKTLATGHHLGTFSKRPGCGHIGCISVGQHILLVKFNTITVIMMHRCTVTYFVVALSSAFEAVANCKTSYIATLHSDQITQILFMCDLLVGFSLVKCDVEIIL